MTLTWWFGSFDHALGGLSCAYSFRLSASWSICRSGSGPCCGHRWPLPGWRGGVSWQWMAWNGQMACLWPSSHFLPWSAGQGSGVLVGRHRYRRTRLHNARQTHHPEQRGTDWPGWRPPGWSSAVNSFMVWQTEHFFCRNPLIDHDTQGG